MKQPKQHQELLRCDLTDDELIGIARKQSATFRDREQADQELTSIKSDFKARLERLESEVQLCTRKITDGFEMRNTDCETRYDDPSKGMASVYRLDTGELVRTRKMDANELQMELEEEADDDTTVTISAEDSSVTTSTKSLQLAADILKQANEAHEALSQRKDFASSVKSRIGSIRKEMKDGNATGALLSCMKRMEAIGKLTDENREWLLAAYVEVVREVAK